MQRLVAALLACAVCLAAAASDSLYATTLRGQGAGSGFIAGNLFAIDHTTAAPTLIGPIRVGDAAVGIAAVGTHPRTGQLYGITAGLSPTLPRSLVKIDLDNGNASVVGPIRVRGSDIGFAPDGTLYMWSPDIDRMVKVDLETAAVAPLGPSGLEGVAGGGIAIPARGGKAFVAVTGASGTLDTIDLETGAATRGPQLTGAPFATAMDNMTFSPAGVLYAVNSNGGAPSSAALVTIDTESGAVTKIGPLPDDVRGLIFAPERAGRLSPSSVRQWTLVVLGLVGVALIGYAISTR